MFRSYVKYGSVEIVRNPYNIQDGIYIVGEVNMVGAVFDALLIIIKEIEERVIRIPKKERGIGHLHHAKSAYRIKLIKELSLTEKFAKELIAIDKEYKKDSRAYKQLRLAYIASCSLRNLKRYYGK